MKSEFATINPVSTLAILSALKPMAFIPRYFPASQILSQKSFARWFGKNISYPKSPVNPVREIRIFFSIVTKSKGLSVFIILKPALFKTDAEVGPCIDRPATKSVSSNSSMSNPIAVSNSQGRCLSWQHSL